MQKRFQWASMVRRESPRLSANTHLSPRDRPTAVLILRSPPVDTVSSGSCLRSHSPSDGAALGPSARDTLHPLPAAHHPLTRCPHHPDLRRSIEWRTYLDGVLALREVRQPLLLALGGSAGLGLGQAAADGAGLLGPQVERQVLLALVVQAQLLARVRVDHRQHAGD